MGKCKKQIIDECIVRNEVINWIKQENYLDELKEYIRLPSRSANSEEVKKCGEMSVKLLESCGLKVTNFETTGNDIIFAESIAGDGLPTILIYGHYDVQPTGNLEEWDSDPFDPIVRGDKLFGRGTADNKGQHFAHILAIRYLRAMNPSVFDRINIKFILDGDEELGSFSLPEVVSTQQELLKCDFVYISDGPALAPEAPTIVGSVRGILDFQLTVKHSTSDLHSGNFGGVARSASRDLVSLLNTLSDENGRVLVDGFYDNIQDPSPIEIDALADLTETYSQITSVHNITLAPTHSGKNNPELNQLFPTLNVNGLQSGGVKKERRTIIPSEAIASIDCRLIPFQDPSDIQIKLEKHIMKEAARLKIGNAVSIDFGHAMDPVESSLNSEYITMVSEAALQGFGVKAQLIPRLGGSLPIYLFPKYLKKPVILVPLSHPDSRNHAPNENLDLPYLESGVAMTVALLQLLSNQ